MRLYDAHNHLQDDRFAGRQAELMAACVAAGVTRMVVNGACEEDWPLVLDLARAYPQVVPSFGYHPWYISERSGKWREALTGFLDAVPAGVGEIGLDRWKAGLDYQGQEEVFATQLTLAAERNLPVSIHCLRAWGRLWELLRAGPRPGQGLLLHSYGGPREMVPALVKLGAYFGFPGYFLHERKARQRDAFREVPMDRVLMETDAPDQLLPETPEGAPHPTGGAQPNVLVDPRTGQPINHPANLAVVYARYAGWRGLPVEELAGQVEENFLRVFGPLTGETS